MPALQTFIVEDSPVIRDSLIATLEELVPIEVVGMAEEEAAAISWLGAHGQEVDLAIVDIFLKSGSGLGVVKAASAAGQVRHVVVLSNYASREMRQKCLELGADRVFDKSTEIDALMLYCEALAGGRSGDTGAAALG